MDTNVDHNWGFNVNLSGITAPTGRGATAVPEGYYRAEVMDMYVNTDKNAGRVIIKLKLVDSGAFTGAIRTDGLNIPKSADDKVRYYWRGLAESAGYMPAQLDEGQITIGKAAFAGKTVHIYYVPKEEGNPSRQYDSVNYLPPVAWNQQKQAFDANAAAPAAPAAPTGSALGGSAPATNGNMLSNVQTGNALGGSAPQNNTVAAGDVLAQLGLGGQASA